MTPVTPDATILENEKTLGTRSRLSRPSKRAAKKGRKRVRGREDGTGC